LKVVRGGAECQLRATDGSSVQLLDQTLSTRDPTEGADHTNHPAVLMEMSHPISFQANSSNRALAIQCRDRTDDWSSKNTAYVREVRITGIPVASVFTRRL
jgi:hypothetical protein